MKAFIMAVGLIISTCSTVVSAKSEVLKAKWKFKQADSKDWFDAMVPGNVHSDLERNSLIPNPFYGTNEDSLQWIEKKDWLYRGVFTVNAATLGNKHVELEFKGLDTYADVTLNGHKLFSSSNMFVAVAKEVKEYLKEGNNVIEILFRSPIAAAMPEFKKSKYTYPADNDRSEEHLSVFTRKAPYHYGWDWGARFVTSGIWRPVVIKTWNEARIEDLQFIQQSVDNGNASYSFIYTIESDIEKSAKLDISVGPKLKVSKNVKLVKGINKIPVEVNIANPKLWWPNGMGEAFLYQVKSDLKINGAVLDTKKQNLGIRTVEVINKTDSLGVSFYIKVNGVPTFMKGANYIPNDAFPGRVSDKIYDRCFKDAVESNLNMLRIWGGGVYEDDYFYEQADKHGILIWQDFMFACTMYPSDSAFLANVAKEAEYNIKRLRNHPSLALWCGNNEIKVGWYNWGWQDKYKYSKEDQKELLDGYDKLFLNLLPGKVKELDPQRFYYDSSPISNWGKLDDMKIADNHYWGVWWGKHEFEKFNEYVPRFMSEFGFQSFPSMKTIQSFSGEKDWDIESAVMKSHQKSSIGNSTIKEYMQRDYRMPRSFEDFVYLNQVMQAEGMRIGFEAHRRSKPFNMGSLYWQFNDVWPVVSWSGIDYYGRWKAMQYFVKKAFAPVITSAALINDTLNVHLISDLLTEAKVTSDIRIITLSGEIVWQQKKVVTIGANENKSILNLPLEMLISGYAKNQLVLVMNTAYDDHIQERTFLFGKVKDLDLKQADLKISVLAKGSKAEVTLQSPVFVKNIELTATGIEGRWSDNYFDMIPGKEYKVTFEGDAKSAGRLKELLQYKSVRNTY